VCFIKPLIEAVRYASKSELNSHIILIPFVVAYLVHLKRKDLPAASKPAPLLAAVAAVLGFLALVIGRTMIDSTDPLARYDYLSWDLLSVVLFAIGSGFMFFGTAVMRLLAFPAAFLLFVVPIPSALAHLAEVFFQYTSAEAANLFLSISNTPFVRDGLVFQLPGINIRVAEECSGIRSSLVLLITSLMAGHLFLTTTWKKTVLALAVIPLGILRNGFRIATIGYLCAHVSPRMIDSPIHHRGGPIFFALSLIPFFVLLHYLRKSEIAKNEPKPLKLS